MAISFVNYTVRFFLQMNAQIEECDALLYPPPNNNAQGPCTEKLLQKITFHHVTCKYVKMVHKFYKADNWVCTDRKYCNILYLYNSNVHTSLCGKPAAENIGIF